MSLVTRPVTAEAAKILDFDFVARAAELAQLFGRLCRKPAGLGVCDGLLITLSAYATLCIDVNHFPLPSRTSQALLYFLIPLMLIRISSLAVFGAYRTIVRHTGVRDVLHIAAATTA